MGSSLGTLRKVFLGCFLGSKTFQVPFGVPKNHHIQVSCRKNPVKLNLTDSPLGGETNGKQKQHSW